jgi:outer membrane receptor protein involved in Fe transport
MQAMKKAPILKLSVLSSAMLISLCAFAQNATTEEDSQTTTEGEAEELDAVVVTGSRIKRAGLDTLEPAVSVSREAIDRRGITNVADSLNEIPGFGVGVTPEGGQAGFGAAVNFVNRFGLGSNRTLTTVNGRRFVSSNPPTIFGPAGAGLQVDLNAIPVQLIERVDNITVGGAPVYGSDAIAGTVNLILRQDYEGAEVGVTYGMTEEGLNERINARGIWGTNFADGRGNFTVAANIDTSEGVLQTERDIFTRAFLNTTNPLASSLGLQPGRTPGNDGRVFGTPFNTGPADGIPNSVLIQNRRIQSITPGGLLFPSTGAITLDASGLLRGFGPNSRSYLQFDRNGNLIPYDPGTPFSSVDSSGGQGFNLVETGQITSDLDRGNLFSNGSFQFTDATRGYYELLYFRSEGTEIIDQPIYNATVFGGVSQALTFQATDPRLSDQARSQLQSLGITSFRLSRASRDLVNNNAKTETNLYRGVLGATTEFDWADRSLIWDISANFGRSDSDNFASVLNQQNFINAINVTRNAAGQIVCDTAGTIGVITGGRRPVADANCVPLDIFGEGRSSAAARAYVTGRTNANSKIDQTIFNTSLAGDLLSYYAGTASFALGYEYRKEEGEFTPDAFQQAGLGRAVAILPNGGEFDTNEIFAELLLPIVSPDQELPGMYALDVELKGRRVDNSVNGAFDTYTYGLQWNVLPDLRLRGNRTRSLRAPAITELFTPASSAFFFVNDPCDGRFINQAAQPGGASGPGSPRFENCQAVFRALGLATQTQPLNNFTATIASASQQGLTSGDPNLDNEESFASTFGFVWEPEFFSGFSLQMDYVEIDIKDAIVSLTGTQVANFCYDDPNFNRATPLQQTNPFCNRLNRTSNGQILPVLNADGTLTPAVRTSFGNAASTDFRGITATAGYEYETEYGYKLDFDVIAFNLRELSTLNGGVRDFADREIGNPRFQNSYRFGVSKNDWTLNGQVNYQSAQVLDRNNTPETRDLLSVRSYKTLDLGASYTFADDLTVRLAITNATDEEPPFGVIGIGTYDILGRRYALTGEYRF